MTARPSGHRVPHEGDGETGPGPGTAAGSAPVPAGPIVERCLGLGFARAGVAPARPSRWADELAAWLAAGRHEPMGWLAEHLDVREDPRRLLEGARSVIAVADRYARGTRDRVAVDPSEPARGRIARYARGRDYHRVIRRRLHELADALRADHPGHEFRACVDTAPILEREVAAAAGLGSIGKHTLLIEPGAGSWMLLGELVTTLPIEPTGSPVDDADPRRRGAGPDVCGSCTRCIDACPTGCIEPFSVDASRCISTLTIEHRGRLDPAMHAAIGDWIFGCDVCQEVCPHGTPTRRSRRLPVHPDYEPRRDGLELLEVLGWTEEDRREAFTSSAMKRAKLPMMKRNALVAAGNRLAAGVDDPALRARIEAIAADAGEPELVRVTAADVLARLAGPVPDRGGAVPGDEPRPPAASSPDD